MSPDKIVYWRLYIEYARVQVCEYLLDLLSLRKLVQVANEDATHMSNRMLNPFLLVR